MEDADEAAKRVSKRERQSSYDFILAIGNALETGADLPLYRFMPCPYLVRADNFQGCPAPGTYCRQQFLQSESITQCLIPDQRI